MSDIYGRRLRALPVAPHAEQRLPTPEPELLGRDLFQTRIDREGRALWVKENLDDDNELGPYDADAFEVAYPTSPKAA